MDIETILTAVTDFADKAHGEQTRKYSPERYIEHPKRVMATVRQYTNDIAMLAAALLHDVLEDTSVTVGEIRTFLADLVDTDTVERTAVLVQELTDVYVKKNYPTWNRRRRMAAEMVRIEKNSPDAQTIKYADIMDNCDSIVDRDHEFAGVFLNECRALLQRINKGNPALYQRAVQRVDNALEQLKHNIKDANEQ